jgi:hypothetical protein
MRILSRLHKAPIYLAFWILADLIYVLFISLFLGTDIPLSLPKFIVVHLLAIAVGTMVMFAGLGAGVLWIPVLTFLDIRPSEAVSISIFTQIAGKGTGSLTYLFNGMVDMEKAVNFIPMALLGVTLGFLAGFCIPMAYDRFLLYIFLLIAGYLLMKTILSLNTPDWDADKKIPPNTMPPLRKSYPVVVFSSFFTGLLSIGNTDWLIPHMTLKLNMETSQAVATSLFIMFVTILFYLILVCISIWVGDASWPHGTSLLFATCSGVIMGGQIGTRLIRIPWLKRHQKHTFIILLAMSIIHLLW